MSEGVTAMLVRVADGDEGALNELLPSIYAELRALAQHLLEGERTGHTLQATALVHEAYLKMIDQRQARWQDRAHFFALAAQAMRRILIDHARTRHRGKRGGEAVKLSLDTQLVVQYEQTIDLLALDDALSRLMEVHPSAARVIELRFFGGLTIDQSAVVMGVSDSSIEREWRLGRAWLYRALGEEDVHDGRPERDQ